MTAPSEKRVDDSCTTTAPNGKSGDNISRLVDIMRRLLAPGGCPWDREQTLRSLRTYVIEEAYEVVDAIDKQAPELLREELGDLLLQIVFQAELARAQGWFGLDDVIDSICEKLVRRHPHVFADTELSTSREVILNWEKLKAAERKEHRTGVLDGVPASLPALLRAMRLGEKVSRIGFDWPDAAGAREKLDEELGEMDLAFELGDLDAVRREIGDVLFTVANLARKAGIDPEGALCDTLARFTRRMKRVERELDDSGRDFAGMTAEQLDELWVRAKKAER